jgi:hypothetical protein
MPLYMYSLQTTLIWKVCSNKTCLGITLGKGAEQKIEIFVANDVLITMSQGEQQTVTDICLSLWFI